MEQNFSLNSLRKMCSEADHRDASLSAGQRVRALAKMAASVDVDQDVEPRCYFRAGLEMERLADGYLRQGGLENAFVLYTKFITLFVEKLPAHKDYQHCRVPEKHVIMKKLQEVAFCRKDELQKRLEYKYGREHAHFLQVQEASAGRRGPSDEERRGPLEAERERVAAMRRSQLATEQFAYFEELLTCQEAANRRGEAAGHQPIGDGVGLAGAVPNRTARPPVSRSASTLHAAYGVGAEHLRRTLLPRTLTSRFLLLADRNSARGIETCGVLCGRLQRDALAVTHVVVPKQSAGPDFCAMEDVEELFGFQDKHQLLTLGWIHTHPTQTVFLSSVDLHTHAAYQLMLAEAIAIVCAPKHDRFRNKCQATKKNSAAIIVEVRTGSISALLAPPRLVRPRSQTQGFCLPSSSCLLEITASAASDTRTTSDLDAWDFRRRTWRAWRARLRVRAGWRPGGRLPAVVTQKRATTAGPLGG
ncbi:AMSH-like protease isoform X2 [Phyllopteryx taeniolatus]|uniref:AMSH-like protease isoform X2 n=1 Tax=Phyllopteryx taeniolatus TaxID=161469 RepID=UPI002AD3BD68|nr:AMSH-like protease isoform X2 [Phyllopteryx taeniolatus]